MRSLRRALLALSLIVVACDPPRPGDEGEQPDAGEEADAGEPDGGAPACVDTCEGCCLEDGTCVAGDTDEACGHHGVTCSACGDDAVCGTEGVCTQVLQPGSGESCETAQSILLVNGKAHVEASLGGTSLHDPRPCVEGVTQDLVFTVTLTEPGRLAALVTSYAATGLSLRRACDGTGACDVTEFQWAAHASIAQAQPGTYFIWVYGQDYESDDTFALDIDFDPASGERCEAPLPLTFANGGFGVRTASATRDLRFYNRAQNLTCGDGWNIDHDYAVGFTTTEHQRLEAKARWTGYDQGSIYLRLVTDDCSIDTSPACAYDDDVIEIGDLPPGNWRLVASGSVWQENIPAPARIDVTLAPPKVGDTCSNPYELTVPAAGGTAVASGNSSGSTRDVDASCADRGNEEDGRDELYAFELTRTMNVTASVTSRESQFDPAITLRRLDECGQEESELACAAGDETATFTRAALPPGRYVLAVDAAFDDYYTRADGGPYDLEVTFAPTLPGETCDDATTLSFVDGRAQVSGTLVGRLADSDLYCGAGADAVYRVTTDREVDLFARAMNGTYPLAVGLGTDACGDSTRIACNIPWSGPPQDLRYGSLPAGTYDLVVAKSSTYSTESAFDLTVETRAHQPGETCSNPIPLAFGADGAARATADLGTFFHDTRYCSAYRPDVFYGFTLTQPKRIAARVSSSTNYANEIVLRASCGTNSDTCNAPIAKGQAIESGYLAAGSYVLEVRGESGTFNLDATLAEPVPGDTCRNPLPLFPSGQQHGTRTFTVDTTTLMKDFNAVCGGGPDIAWEFTVTQPTTLRAHAITPGDSFSAPRIHLQGGGAGCANLIDACGGEFVDGGELFEVAALAPGTYRLVLGEESYTSTPNTTYQVTVTLAPPAAGDSCTNPIPLAVPAGGGTVAVSGTTDGFFRDVSSVCSAGGYATNGRDVVYAATLTQSMHVRAQITSRTTGFKPSLYTAQLAQGTCSYLQRFCANTDTYRATADSEWLDVPPGTYLFVVDNRDQYSGVNDGAYDIEFRFIPKTAGETCANPIPLTLTNGQATASGDIAMRVGDTYANCGWSDPNEDAVYRFTLSQQRYVRAEVTTNASAEAFRPAVHLRPGSCGASSVSCNAETDDGFAAASARLPAGTHYVFVAALGDGFHTGTYDLQLTAGDAPQGDTCQNPIPLTLSNGAAGGTARVTGDTGGFYADLLPSCGGFSGSTPSADGRDVVYSFTIDRPLKLEAKLDQTLTEYSGVLSLRSSCSGSDVTCVGGVGAYAPGILRRDLAAGTHLLVVDGGFNAYGRAFTLDVSLTPP